MTTEPRRWLCPRPSCGHLNELRGTSRKCQGCGRMTRRKKRVPKHARTVRDDSYETYVAINRAIHTGPSRIPDHEESCGVCGKPRGENRRHDRDHDHRTGQPRGLACFHCNRELLRHATLEQARQVVAYLERVEAFYAKERDTDELG